MKIAVLNEKSLDALELESKAKFNLATTIINCLRIDMDEVYRRTEKFKNISSDDLKEALLMVRTVIEEIFPEVAALIYNSFLEEIKKDIEFLSVVIPGELPMCYTARLRRYLMKITDINLYCLTQILTNELSYPSENPEYLKIKIDYFPYNHQGQLYEAYKFESFFQMEAWAIIKILKAGLPIKECKNCHKVFIPQKRSDEIYCDYIYSNSRTCKQVGYENKDEFTKAYRTAYKTKNAAKNRNIKNNPNAEKNFRKWVYEARLKLEDGREGKISLEDFKGWLRQGNKRDVSVKKIAKSSITNEVWADTIKRITERSKKNRGG
jgi:DNA-directed RNA polymerase subunit M/transcription elongation factor TFIIS